MQQYKKLGKNLALISIGNFASKFLSFAFVPLYTAILSTEQYGTIDIVAITISLVAPVLTLQIWEAMMRFALDSENDPRQVFMGGITVAVVGLAAFLVLSPIFLLIPIFREYYFIVVFYYFSYVIYHLLSSFARGVDAVHHYAIGGIINTCAVIALNLLFLLVFKWSVNGYLLSFAISYCISSLYLFSMCRLSGYIIPIKQVDRRLVREMLRYSVPMIPNELSWWASDSSSKLLLTLNIGLSITGVYSIAYKIPSILNTLGTVFISAWRISAVEDFGSKESIRFHSDIYDKYSGVLFITAAVVIFANKPLAAILYSKDFYAAWTYVPLLVVAVVFNKLAGFLGSIYTCSKKTNMLFVSSASAAGINILLNLLLIPKLSATGSAIAALVSYSSLWLVRLIHSRKIIKIEYRMFKNVISFVLLAALVLLSYLEMRFVEGIQVLLAVGMLLIHLDTVKELTTAGIHAIEKFVKRI